MGVRDRRAGDRRGATFISPKARIRPPLAVRVSIEIDLFTIAAVGLWFADEPVAAVALAVLTTNGAARSRHRAAYREVVRASSLELVEPKDRAAWRRWLERHHATSGSVRLALVKATSDARGVRYAEAVEEALCFGWIDSTAGRLDDDRYTVLMTRRKARSGWSAVNKDRIERLVREGRMAAPGLAAIDAAKADGSWSKLDASHALEIPPDLAIALRAYPNARRHFDAFPPSSRRIILQWMDDAKRSETREKRIAETARLAERNARANHPR